MPRHRVVVQRSSSDNDTASVAIQKGAVTEVYEFPLKELRSTYIIVNTYVNKNSKLDFRENLIFEKL